MAKRKAELDLEHEPKRPEPELTRWQDPLDPANPRVRNGAMIEYALRQGLSVSFHGLYDPKDLACDEWPRLSQWRINTLNDRVELSTSTDARARGYIDLYANHGPAIFKLPGIDNAVYGFGAEHIACEEEAVDVLLVTTCTGSFEPLYKIVDEYDGPVVVAMINALLAEYKRQQLPAARLILAEVKMIPDLISIVIGYLNVDRAVATPVAHSAVL